MRERVVVYIFLSGIFLVVPLIIGGYWLYIVNLALLYVVLASTWNLLYGFTGLFSFAHPGIFAISAYASTVLAQLGFPIPFAMITSSLISTASGFALAFVSMRSRGFYLAMVTWCFSEVIRIFLFMTFRDFTIAPTLRLNYSSWYYLLLFFAIISSVVINKIINSKIGYYLRAIKDNEDVANVMGVNTLIYKLLCFSITSFLVGLSGAFYAHYVGIVSPSLAGFTMMGQTIIMCLLGGIGSFIGPILGAIIITFFFQALRQFQTLWLASCAILAIVVMKFCPEGIISIIKKKAKPFREWG